MLCSVMLGLGLDKSYCPNILVIWLPVGFDQEEALGVGWKVGGGKTVLSVLLFLTVSPQQHLFLPASIYAAPTTNPQHLLKAPPAESTIHSMEIWAQVLSYLIPVLQVSAISIVIISELWHYSFFDISFCNTVLLLTSPFEIYNSVPFSGWESEWYSRIYTCDYI